MKPARAADAPRYSCACLFHRVCTDIESLAVGSISLALNLARPLVLPASRAVRPAQIPLLQGKPLLPLTLVAPQTVLSLLQPSPVQPSQSLLHVCCCLSHGTQMVLHHVYSYCKACDVLDTSSQA